MTPPVAALDGPWWPYLALLLFCVLPTEIWRWMAVALSRGLDPASPALVWVRHVASALVMAVVARLVTSPSGALADVPLWLRLGALGVGLGTALAFGRRPIAGVGAGVGALVLGRLLLGS